MAMGDEPKVKVKVPKYILRRTHKGRRFIPILIDSGRADYRPKNTGESAVMCDPG
jgi:hypothetical protein